VGSRGSEQASVWLPIELAQRECQQLGDENKNYKVSAEVGENTETGEVQGKWR